MRFSNRRFRVATVLLLGGAILALMSAAWAVIGEGTAPAQYSASAIGGLRANRIV